MPQMLRNRLSSKMFLYPLPLIALLFSASGAFATAPNVVVDAQETLQSGLNGPQSIALAPNNSYYVADSGNNRVLLYAKGTVTTVGTGGFTLVSPQALAVDSLGDLFIGDSPSSGVGRVIEAHATGGVLNGTVTQVVSGGALKDVTALTVNTNASSSTLNTLFIGDDLSATIYSVAAGSTTLANTNITGLPSNIYPSALVVDQTGDLFVADYNSTLYEVPANSTLASIYFVSGFTVYSPTGLAVDPKGDLYILTLTSTGSTPSQTVPQNVIEIPGGDPTSAFQVPVTGLQNSSGIGIDTDSNVYVVDFINDNVTELVYGSPVGLSQVAVGAVGTSVVFNYELNAGTTLRGFQSLSGGDKSTEVQAVSGTCVNGKYTDGNNGGGITPANPFTCQENVAAAPAYPGLRYGALELKGTGGTILASTLVYSTGIAGASVVYPLRATTTVMGLNGPQALAVSGLDKELYLIVSGPPATIYSVNSPNGKKLTAVSTAPITLSDPLGIAVNGEGDLYIADAGDGRHDLVVVPALPGVTPYAVNPGNLLQNPISVAFDTAGDLFIGDLGPAGFGTGLSFPGYIVEVPAGGGTPFKLNTGSVTIYYPAALAADPYTGALLVGDIGYENATDGSGGSKVLSIPPGGGSAVDVPGFDGTNPVGIVFDPAEEYYILDGTANTLTVVQPTGSSYQVGQTSPLINGPSALAITNGGQNFVVSNYSSTGSLVYLDGELSILDFGSLPVGDRSSTLDARINNIGSSALTLGNPYLTGTGNIDNFDLLYSTTCADSLVLAPAATCDNYVQFTPVTTGTDTVNATVQTNGYLPSSSVIRATGRGTK